MVLPPAAGNKSRATTSAAADCHPPPPGLTASPDASRSPACSNGPRVDGRSRYPTTHPVHHSVPPPPPGAPTDLRRDAPGRLFLRAIQSIQSIQSIHPFKRNRAGKLFFRHEHLPAWRSPRPYLSRKPLQGRVSTLWSQDPWCCTPGRHHGVGGTASVLAADVVMVASSTVELAVITTRGTCHRRPAPRQPQLRLAG